MKINDKKGRNVVHQEIKKKKERDKVNHAQHCL